MKYCKHSGIPETTTSSCSCVVLSIGVYKDFKANLLLCRSRVCFFTLFQCLLLQDFSALNLWSSASTCDSPPPLIYDGMEDTTSVHSAAPSASGLSLSVNAANMKEYVWVNWSYRIFTWTAHLLSLNHTGPQDALRTSSKCCWFNLMPAQEMTWAYNCLCRLWILMTISCQSYHHGDVDLTPECYGARVALTSS